jgi:hypothetical protein
MKDFNWKRCLFRTVSVIILLFIAETIPSFGNILDLVTIFNDDPGNKILICPGHTKGGSITVPLTSCLTGLD